MCGCALKGELDVSPLPLPGVRHGANNGAEHEGSDEGEEHEVDEALQSVVTQPRHGLDEVLQQKKKERKKRRRFHFGTWTRSGSASKTSGQQETKAQAVEAFCSSAWILI